MKVIAEDLGWVFLDMILCIPCFVLFWVLTAYLMRKFPSIVRSKIILTLAALVLPIVYVVIFAFLGLHIDDYHILLAFMPEIALYIIIAVAGVWLFHLENEVELS